MEMGLAMAIKRAHRQHVISGLRMNVIFFLMSTVVLVVMAISMWKDTHPEWLSYQEKFKRIERRVLIAQRADLLRQIEHPDYQGDYLKERKQYQDAKAVFDSATSTLEATEASLEELDLQVHSSEPAEGDTAAPLAATASIKGGRTAKPSGDETAELDKEFAAGGGATPAPTAGKKGSPSSGPSKNEAAELDKEFASEKSGSPTAKPQSPGGKSGKSEMDNMDKEFQSADAPKGSGKGTKSGTSTPPPKGTSGQSELDTMDQEFQSADAPKATGPVGKGANPASATPSGSGEKLTFEEATFEIKIDQAEARVEAASRDLLTQQRVHSREMIGLPEDASLQRQLADGQLTEAQQSLTVAQSGLGLEERKVTVKAVAQVALWAQDAKELLSVGKDKSASPEHLAQLQVSAKKLADHEETLKRDLKLLDAQIERNHTVSPGVQQVFCERLGSVDRCTTCHRATEDPRFASAPEPFRSHSSKLLQWHPVERFGCVSCHGGYGIALEKGEAHGGIVGKGTPLLVGDHAQASCGKCHGDSKQLTGESTFLAGNRLFKNSGCLGCHKVLGVDTTQTKAGPGLDRLVEKVRPEWLVPWLRNPQSHSIEARMPNLGLTQTEATQMSVYLLTQGTAPDGPAAALPTVSNAFAGGKRLMVNLGCLGCHTVRGEGSSIGPDLSNMRGKVRPEWLFKWIENPKQYLPNSQMPVFGLTRAQTQLMGNYLLSLEPAKKTTLPVTLNLADSAMAKAGADEIAKRGCVGCHDMKGFARLAAPELSNIADKTVDLLEFGKAKSVKRTTFDYMVAKIINPREFDSGQFTGRMPKFGLDQNEARAIGIYLLSRTSKELPPEFTKDLTIEKSPLVAGRKLYDQHSCASCHRVSGVGGKIGPELTREGEMVQPSWLFKFLKRPERLRWWQDSRMPDFHLTNEEATVLTEYLMAMSNQPAPYEYAPPESLVFPLASAGAKYFSDLKCQSCHPLGGKQSTGGGDVKKLGPDLAMSPRRLKRDWMLRFLKDPQGFSPGTQMPTFNKPDYEYQAVIDYLMKQKEK